MLNLLTTFTNTNGLSFPNTAAVNSSGGSATDGTEFIAAMVNDSMWGWMQALLNYTGQSPNGVVESIANSQILEALRRFETPGKIIATVWNDDPATLGIRALMLTGQGILRANYPELDSVVYCGDANNATYETFYHADDAAGTTRNTAGVYLILPDARGRVVRGLDLTGSVDPDGATRVLGSLQEDAMQRITGTLWDSVSDIGFRDISSGVFGQGASTENRFNGTVSTVAYRLTFDNSDSVSPNAAKTNDDETRAINIAANLMITY